MEATGNESKGFNKLGDFIRENKIISAILVLLILSILRLLYHLIVANSSCQPCASCSGPSGLVVVTKSSSTNGATSNGATSGDSSSREVEGAVKNGKPTIVCYYATWCGYSRMFLPEWDQFEKRASRELPGVGVKKVKCEGDGEKLCTKMGVEGFPTVILYTPRGQVNFEGPRTADNLIKFCKNHM